MEPTSNRQPERRIHKVFVTRNTEYHVRRGQVVAVRRRGTSEWLTGHSAMNLAVEGHVEAGGFAPQPGAPSPGERLYLARPGKDVLTSTVVSIERPEKALVQE